MVCAIRLNGKQVKYLRCPRNGKQVWTHQHATVSNHGKAMRFVLRARISALSAESRKDSTGREMLRAAHGRQNGQPCRFATLPSCFVCCISCD